MRRKHIRATVVMLVVAFPGLLLMFLAVALDPSLGVLFLFLWVLVLLICGVYLRYTWSCPNCDLYLGQGQFLPGWDITHCRYCGVHLR